MHIAGQHDNKIWVDRKTFSGIEYFVKIFENN